MVEIEEIEELIKQLEGIAINALYTSKYGTSMELKFIIRQLKKQKVVRIDSTTEVDHTQVVEKTRPGS